MTIKRRLERLESRYGIGDDTGPKVIVLQGCWREGDHVKCRPVGAHVKTEKGWQSILRDEGETAEEYLARLELTSTGS